MTSERLAELKADADLGFECHATDTHALIAALEKANVELLILRDFKNQAVALAAVIEAHTVSRKPLP